MSPSPRVSIVILNYNGLEHLDDCLRSVERMTYPRDRLRVILADNGSTDASLDHVRRHYPWVEIDDHQENLGFAAGNNRSAQRADTELVAFLNNDVRVAPDWLEPLCDALDSNPDVICAGSHVLDFRGERVLYAGSEMHFSGFGYQKGMGEPLDDHPTDVDPRETLFATGCAMLVRRDAYVRTGGFDEDYFAYYEDVDLGWRWWVLGYRVLYVPRSTIYHKGDASFRHAPSDRKQMMWNRNVLGSMFKNYEDAHLAKLLPVALLLTIERALFFLDVEGSESTAKVLAYFPGVASAVADEQRIAVGLAHLRAIREFVNLLPVFQRKRREIQAGRGRSDSEIFAKFPLEVDYRDQVNEAATNSMMARLLPAFDLSDLLDSKRLDASAMHALAKLEGAVDHYRGRVEILEGELARRAGVIDDWVAEAKKLDAEVGRLVPFEAELANIKSKKWYKAIEALRRFRSRFGGSGST